MKKIIILLVSIILLTSCGRVNDHIVTMNCWDKKTSLFIGNTNLKYIFNHVAENHEWCVIIFIK